MRGPAFTVLLILSHRGWTPVSRTCRACGSCPTPRRCSDPPTSRPWSSTKRRPRSCSRNSRRAPTAVTSWLGDSIGLWDGDVFVVETRGFTPSDRVRFGGPSSSFLVSPRTVVTERFARVAEDRIDYSFVVDDPTYYTQPWQGESHFLRRDEPMLEYACHEANYSLVHILEGARERERQAVR